MPKPQRNIQNHLKCLLKASLLSKKLIYFGAGCTRTSWWLTINAAMLGNNWTNSSFTTPGCAECGKQSELTAKFFETSKLGTYLPIHTLCLGTCFHTAHLPFLNGRTSSFLYVIHTRMRLFIALLFELVCRK